MMGGGLCWIDYDDDGWLDLFVVNAYADDDTPAGRRAAACLAARSSTTSTAGSWTSAADQAPTCSSAATAVSQPTSTRTGMRICS